jgi:DNA polymerase I
MSESTGLASFEARFPSGIWACDFEFNGGAGERPDPVCMVARNLASDQTIRLWRDELYALDSAPFPTGPDALFVAFYASAELGCFLALGWQLPTNTLDLFVEQRWLTNGLPTAGRSLLSALHYYGIAAMGAEEKEDIPASACTRGLLLGRTCLKST